jgi:hypothetical protein
MRTTVGIKELESRLNLLIGKPVWSARVPLGSEALIEFGEKIERPLQKMYGPGAPYKGDLRYKGELTLRASCAWRVELEGAGILSGSGELEDETMLSGLTKLIGQTVAEVSVNSFLDLLVVFSGSLRLRLFCDQGTGDLDYDSCYTLLVRSEGSCSVGNGAITLERDSEEASSS